MCGNAERVLCGAMERDRSKCDAACAYERIETRYVYNTNQRNGTKLVISFYVWISEYNKNKNTNNNSVRGSRRTKITVHCEYAVPAFVIIIFAAFSLLMCFISFSSAPASQALSLSLWLDELEIWKRPNKKMRECAIWADEICPCRTMFKMVGAVLWPGRISLSFHCEQDTVTKGWVNSFRKWKMNNYGIAISHIVRWTLGIRWTNVRNAFTVTGYDWCACGGRRRRWYKRIKENDQRHKLEFAQNYSKNQPCSS